MKKILAAAAILSTLPFVLTGCGENDEPDATGREHFEDYDYGNDADVRDDNIDRDDNDVEDFAHDAIDGAGDAANDIIDGFDGERETNATSGNFDDNGTTTTVKVDER